MRTVRGACVLITGAASGMGKLYAIRALSEGAAAVVLWDVNAEALAATEAELTANSAKTRIRSYTVDVSDMGAIAKAAQQVRKHGLEPDILINNAGIVRGNEYFWNTDAGADVRPTILVNTLAPMLIAREFLPGMIARGRSARIVNVASAAGTLGNPRMASYAGSKAAVIGWSDSLRIELRQSGNARIAVTTVAPTYISTGMFAGAKGPALAPIMTPEFVVNRVWNAMLHGDAFVFLPWSVKLSRALKAILPTPLFDWLVGGVLGVYSSMDKFTGRAGERR
ncbi:MAG: SDR family NAD(P)-dependent oxidoreductase [Agromyces sp.]